ncbi:MAG: hypothetical protein B6226_04050 [Candidatus Cloacimonetes bacterium 4572_65]|nr:MAG: hypothetical protein B6226_04050 [Candidatus Cloacimonetes bacterium 4572_65]
MKRYIFITIEGTTFQPHSDSVIPDVENSQVIGFAEGIDADEAFSTLLNDNSYLQKSSFNEVIAYQLSDDSHQDKKKFYIPK